MGSSKPRTEAAAPRVESFPPQLGACCRVLILGSVPSRRSLELRQSYGHAQNLFWPFMGELFDAGPGLPYAERIARLQDLGIGIWDVLERCERRGSLDGDIITASEVANDVPGLLVRHPEVRAIALNGSKAAEVFRRRIAPQISATRMAALQILALPSTSPANASIPRARKLECWRVLREWILPA
ncbi:DNA-deoxyinosine glycosylase [Dokdonella sp.]|uniref:DNA-deoxyinosine glycosylase n=1 Tax=Dokdonella sp. TaxID=2291710 RepID=UPI0025C70129|nr:DNA-deoxyinosine glycosylase [Dokdonella sp.]MBX3687917.1 DNA-deoxyinosine glycosylase [Dokdonella sp.]